MTGFIEAPLFKEAVWCIEIGMGLKPLGPHLQGTGQDRFQTFLADFRLDAQVWLDMVGVSHEFTRLVSVSPRALRMTRGG
ncbi:hypothetical protein GCM10007159_28890 [Modicisalibacter luteus]|nr:hypothetical protein GCM10007159_28890 [Halomonas lutea]